MFAVGHKDKSLEEVVHEMLSDPNLSVLSEKTRYEAKIRRLRSELRRYVHAPNNYGPQIEYLQKVISEIVP